MESVIDLKIVDGDLAFGPDGEPLTVSGTDAIAQDVKHRVLESGLAPLLVADDNPAAAGMVAIARVVEEDLRIRPGTARIAGPDASGGVVITARTMDGENLSETVNA